MRTIRSSNDLALGIESTTAVKNPFVIAVKVLALRLDIALQQARR